MAKHEQREALLIRTNGFAFALVAAWTVAVATSLTWNLHQEKLEVVQASRIRAQTSYERDLMYRCWLSNHGGVYVWATDQTQPDPFLDDVPRRDIHTPEGKLTLVSPATVARQVNEMQSDTHDVLGHITSLDPVNPENIPDTWERKALQAFEHGEKEVSSVERMAGKAYVRLMFPLVIDDTCLKCHGRQGYQVGDIRGGISVSVPTAPMWATAKMHMLTLSVGHGFLWLLGLGGIGLGMRGLRRQAKERYRAEQKLRESEIRMRTLTERNARVKAEQTLLATEDKLLMARRIQESFLPDSAPAVDGFDIGGLSCPAESTSGDYYDYLPMRNGRIGIVIADVSGHGIGPALFAAETSAYLRASAEVSGDVGEILTRLNAFLSANERNDRFVTLFLACLNPQDRSLVYASAGHQCYLFNGTQGATALDATGIPLGVMPGTVYPSSGPLTLEPGDSVLFVTDGILETSNQNGDSFGVGRVLDLVQANRDKPAREIVDLLYSTARKFSDDKPQLDDMTAVILKTGFARP